MVPNVRIWCAGLMLLALSHAAFAQEAAPGPVTVTTLPHPQFPEAAPANTGVPDCGCVGLPACAPFEDCNGNLLVGDPLLDRPEWPTPGLFEDLELGILKPHIKFALQEPVNVANLFTDVVAPTFTPLDWTGSPRFELGYRFPQAFGELVVGYRGLFSEGLGTLAQFDFGPASVRSRLNLNSLDIDYGQREYGLGPCWDMKWRLGVRLASVYFDSQIGGIVEEQRATSDYIGAGPHAQLELWRQLGCDKLSAYMHLEAAALLGRVSQNFEETFVLGSAALGGATHVGFTQTVPVVEAQFGLCWTPLHDVPVRVSCGYDIESWWYVGRTDVSAADLWLQGVFLRGEWRY
jgi:hypothetical protein